MALTTYCYNLSGAMSIWTNVAFTRIWRVGSKYFGITQSGVFELTGNTDNGTSFVSKIITSNNDLGKFNLKRLPSARVNSSQAGTITASMDGDSSTGIIQFTKSERVKFGKGMKGRMLSLNIQSSADGFELQSIELHEKAMQRGVK